MAIDYLLEVTERPSEITASYLLSLGTIGVDPTDDVDPSGITDKWKIFCTNVPADPDDLITITNTTPVNQGRSGDRTIQKFGINTIVRSACNDEGYAKGQEIKLALDQVKRVSFVFKSVTYVLHSYELSSGLIPLGKELESSKRYMHSINHLLSIDIDT